MKTALLVILTAVFSNNFVLSRQLGVCPMLGTARRLDSSAAMSAAVTAVMVLATAICWPLHHFILLPQGMEYMQTTAFILVIALLVQGLDGLFKKRWPQFHKAFGIYLPLITSNCAVLGVVVMNIDQGLGYGLSLLHSLAAGLGFLLAMVMFAGIREKIEDCDIPESFRGTASVLIAAGILSLSFMGFYGMAENMLGL